jgi:hypothetical protein
MTRDDADLRTCKRTAEERMADLERRVAALERGHQPTERPRDEGQSYDHGGPLLSSPEITTEELIDRNNAKLARFKDRVEGASPPIERPCFDFDGSLLGSCRQNATLCHLSRSRWGPCLCGGESRHYEAWRKEQG